MGRYVICTECDDEFEMTVHYSAYDGPDFCPSCRSIDTLEDREDD